MKTLIELTQSALAVLASLTPLAPWGLCGASAPVNALKPGDTTEAVFRKDNVRRTQLGGVSEAHEVVLGLVRL